MDRRLAPPNGHRRALPFRRPPVPATRSGEHIDGADGFSFCRAWLGAPAGNPASVHSVLSVLSALVDEALGAPPVAETSREFCFPSVPRACRFCGRCPKPEARLRL